jgi:hypothetical protein
MMAGTVILWKVELYTVAQTHFNNVRQAKLKAVLKIYW